MTVYRSAPAERAYVTTASRIHDGETWLDSAVPIKRPPGRGWELVQTHVVPADKRFCAALIAVWSRQPQGEDESR